MLLAIALCSCANVVAQLPDAPPPSTTCISHNKPCPEWLHKIIGQYPPSAARHGLPSVMPGPVHVYTFRKHWDDPPLRTYRKTFTSPWFLASQGAMFASMVIACRRSRYTGEEFHSEVPWTVGVFGLNLLADRYLDELYAVGSAAVVSQHYIRATIEGPINH
ncbi:MAG: hypothetical protein ACM3WP_12445 [Acidobacteriota bacterium]